MDRNDYIIRIVLRARDELSGTLAKVRSEIEAFAGQNSQMEQSSNRVSASIEKIGNTSKATADKVVAANKDVVQSQGEVDESAKNLESSITALHGKYEKYQTLVREGKADREDQIQQLKRFGQEWQNLARQTDVGSEMALSLGRLAREAQATASRMETIDRQMEAARVAANNRLRALREKEFQQEIKDRNNAAADAVKAEEDKAKRILSIVDDYYDSIASQREKDSKDAARVAQDDVDNAVRVEVARHALNEERRRAADQHEAEQQRIMRLNASYDMFVDRLEAGAVSTNEARASLSRYASEFNKLANSYEAGSAGATRYGERAQASRAALNEFNNAIRSSSADVETNRGLMDRWADSIDRNNFHLASLSAQLRGLAYAAAITFAQQLLTILVSLGGTLVSVASSASLAGAALAGGLAAGAAQAIPVVALLVAAVQRVGSVMDAVKQANLVAEQQGGRADATSRRAATATDALANAQDSLTSANQRVVSANEQVEAAQNRLTEARRAARRELTDLVLAERGAELAARGAALSQEEAQDALRQALSTGATGDIARRRLSVDESSLQGDEVAERLRRSRADAARGIDAGVRGAPGVVQARQGVQDARQQVRDAERGVERAQRAVEQARRQGQAAGEEALASVGKLNYLLEQLSPAERRLYEAMQRIQETYRTEFRGITDIIIGSFTHAVTRADELLRDPEIQDAARNLSRVMADSFREVTDAFSDDEAQRQFIFFASESGRNMGVLNDAAISVGRALMNMAEGAAPLLREIVDHVRDWAQGFEQTTAKTDDLENFFDRAGDHLFVWTDALGAAWDLLKEIIGASEGSGLTAMQDFADVMREGADYIRSNSEEVHAFFEDARTSSYDVLRVLWELAKAVVDVFDPEHTENLADFFIEVLIPAFQNSIETLGFFTNIVMSLLSLPIIGDLARLAIEFGIFVRLLRTFSALAFSGKVALLGREATETAPAIKGLFGQLKDMGSYMRSGFTGAIGAVRAAFKALAGGQGIGGAITAFKDYISNARRASRAPVPGGVDVDGNPVDGDGAGRQRSSRRRNVARGVGAAAVVGAGIGISQTGSDNFRDMPSGSIGAIPANIARDLKAIGGALVGFDLAGAFGAMKREVDGSSQALYDFSQVADKDFKKAVEENDVERLRELSKQAKEGAKEFPEYADSLEKFAEGADKAAAKADELNGVLKTTGRFAEQIREEGGINAEDIVDGSAVAQLLSNLGRMKTSGVNSIADLRENMKFNMDAISRGINEGSESWYTAMSRNFGSGISSLKDAMKDGRISSEQGLKEINRITRTQMRFVRDNMGTLSRDAKNRLANNFEDARLAIERSTGGWEKATGSALRRIKRLMREELRLYGITGSQATNIMKGDGRGGQFGDMDNNRGRESGTDLNYGDAEGRYGFVGGQGERGADSPANMVNGRPVGRGEFVGNWAHEKYIAPAVQAYYGHSFADTFKRVRGHHAGNVDGRGWQGGYAGGFAGRTPSGNRTTAIPGFPGEFIASSVLGQALALIRRFKLFVTDAFATSGHQGGGHLNTGTAMDVVPGPGADWDNVDAAVAYARSRGLTVLYNGVAGHGRGHHAHIELAAGADIAGGGGTGNIRRVRVRGPESPIKRIAQGAVDAVRRGANQRLRQATGVTSEGMEDISGIKVGEGQLGIARTIVQVGRRMGASAKVLLSAIETAIVESGLRNLSYGDRDSVGVFQQRPTSGWTGLMNVPKAAAEYFAQAIKNAPNYGTAGQLAQSVQRSGFPAKYDQARNQAVDILRQIGVRGFQYGGAIPGYGGGDRNLIATEGGEHVWTKEEVAKAGGHGVMLMLRNWLGGGAQSEGAAFQNGGGVPPNMEQRTVNLGGRNTTYSLPNILPISVSGVVREIQKLNAAIRRTSRKTDESMAKYVDRFVSELNDLTRENGLLDQLNVAMEQATARRSLRLAQQQFSGRGDIRQSMTPEEIARAQERNLRADSRDIEQARRLTRQGLRQATGRLGAVDDRIDRLRRGGVTGDERKEITQLRENRGTLVSSQRNLRTRIAQYDTTLADNLASRFQLQVDAFQASVTEITTRFQRRNAGLDRRQRIAEALGNTGDINNIMAERLKNAGDEMKALQGRLKRAQRRGLTEQAAALQDQVAELQNSITEVGVQQFHAAIDAVNKNAETGMFFNDIATRMNEIGDPNFGRRGDLLGQRGGILANQRNSIAGLLGQAGSRGDQAMVEQLTRQLTELDASIAENVEAIKDNTREARQAAIDRITGRGSFLGGVFGGLGTIATTIGQMTGSSTTQTMLGLAQQGGQVLAQTGAGLRDQLAGAFGIDLRGLSGLDFVDAVKNLNFDQITAGMSEKDRSQFESLIQAIIENEAAVQGNTEEIKNLTGSSGQTFSSTAWSMFRMAVFNGSGGLLPQYSGYVPQFSTGGTMPHDGFAYLHRGEVISNPNRGQGDGEHHEHFHITTPVQTVDYPTLSRESSFARRARGKAG